MKVYLKSDNKDETEDKFGLKKLGFTDNVDEIKKGLNDIVSKPIQSNETILLAVEKDGQLYQLNITAGTDKQTILNWGNSIGIELSNYF